MDSVRNTRVTARKQVVRLSLAQQLEEFPAYIAAFLLRNGSCSAKNHTTLDAAMAAASAVGLPPWILTLDPENFQCSCDFLFNFPEFLSLVLAENRVSAEDRSAIARLIYKQRSLEQFEDMGEGAGARA